MENELKNKQRQCKLKHEQPCNADVPGRTPHGKARNAPTTIVFPMNAVMDDGKIVAAQVHTKLNLSNHYFHTLI
jgi:hypothetical protein